MGFSYSKWGKYKLMKIAPELNQHLPDTSVYKEMTFIRLLNNYNIVMLKPFHGLKGYGVIKVSKLKNCKYELHQENERQILKGSENLLVTLRNRVGFKKYIVQRCIPLATINEQPFDIRVMVQRTDKLPWEVTGNYIKVAYEGFVVTNATTQILPFDQALKLSSLWETSSGELLVEINKLALVTARYLGKSFTEIRNIGLDIGLDRYGFIWIIEANFKPSISPFRRLKDETMYRKIAWYKRQV